MSHKVDLWAGPTTYIMDVLMKLMTGNTFKDLGLIGYGGGPIGKGYGKGALAGASDQAADYVNKNFKGTGAGTQGDGEPSANADVAKDFSITSGLGEEGGLLPWGFNTYLGNIESLAKGLPKIKEEYDTRSAPVTEKFVQGMDTLRGDVGRIYGKGEGAFDQATNAVARPVVNVGVGNARLPIYNNALARTRTGIGQGYTQLGTQRGATEGGLLDQEWKNRMQQIGSSVDLTREGWNDQYNLNQLIGGLVVDPAMATFWGLMGNPSQGASYTHQSDPKKSPFSLGASIGLDLAKLAAFLPGGQPIAAAATAASAGPELVRV